MFVLGGSHFSVSLLTAPGFPASRLQVRLKATLPNFNSFLDAELALSAVGSYLASVYSSWPARKQGNPVLTFLDFRLQLPHS